MRDEELGGGCEKFGSSEQKERGPPRLETIPRFSLSSVALKWFSRVRTIERSSDVVQIANHP